MTVIDTQVVLWMTHQPENLSVVAVRAISEADLRGEVAIADITLNEVAMVLIRKRVEIDKPIDAYLRFVEERFRVVPITGEIAIQAHRFGPAYPRDPADRLIGATVLVHGGRLVTADRAICASSEVPCVW